MVDERIVNRNGISEKWLAENLRGVAGGMME
jgi:hypothetical protein